MLIASRETAERLGLRPRAIFRHFAVGGDDAVWVLTAPNPVTRKLYEKTGLTTADFDAIEVNEAFASITMAWEREFKPEPEKLNPRGGAIAIGHPLGASGIRLMTTMLHYLEDTGGRLGFQTMCEGGGQANATVIERL
jgi:acetyl-CoA acyltransferase